MNTERDSAFFLEFYYWLCLVKSGRKCNSLCKVYQYRVLCFVTFAGLLLMCTFSGLYIRSNYKFQTFMLLLLDYAQLIGPLTLHFLLLVDSVLKSGRDQEIWDIAQKLDEIIDKLHTQHTNRDFLRRFFKKFIIIVAISPIPIIVIISSTFRAEFAWSLGWIVRLWPVLSIFLQISHYTLHVVYLTSISEKIGAELKDILNFSSQNSSKFRQRIIRERLVVARKVHHVMWELFRKFDSRFNFFLSVMIINMWTCTLSTIYWIGRRLYYQIYYFFFGELISL